MFDAAARATAAATPAAAAACLLLWVALLKAHAVGLSVPAHRQQTTADAKCISASLQPAAHVLFTMAVQATPPTGRTSPHASAIYVPRLPS
jgi:hypothetical protein